MKEETGNMTNFKEVQCFFPFAVIIDHPFYNSKRNTSLCRALWKKFVFCVTEKTLK